MSRPRLTTADYRTARLPPKEADPELRTPEHLAWRSAVIARAGGRCEWITNGIRCEKAEPTHRMYADHIDERSDGGARYDTRNGRCLCAVHHTRKTAAARAKRHGIAS
jgi:hypothetical protein